MRREVENQMRDNAEADRTAQGGPAESLLDDQPREDRHAHRNADRVRIGHVREVDVRDAVNGGFSRRSQVSDS